jgi:hypothetical protein
MSSVDVGDTVDIAYNGTTGSTVVVDWLDPDQVPTLEDVAVPESPAGSGRYPWAIIPAGPGTWTAVFRESGADVQIERFYVRAALPTGPPPLAVLDDVKEQFGVLTVAQQTLASALLRAASKLIRSRHPLIDQNIKDGVLDPDVVALGVTNMVLRVLRNPAGLRAETIGPFSRTYDTTAAAGLLVITDAEDNMFTPPAILAEAAFPIGTIHVRAGFPHSMWGRCGF